MLIAPLTNIDAEICATLQTVKKKRKKGKLYGGEFFRGVEVGLLMIDVYLTLLEPKFI
jgi:hypothetical protein